MTSRLSYRFSPATVASIARLSALWSCSKTDAVVRAIALADSAQASEKRHDVALPSAFVVATQTLPPVPPPQAQPLSLAARRASVAPILKPAGSV